MSYIPDFRGEDNKKLLNDVDKAFISGFRMAMEMASNFFENLDLYYENASIEEKVLDEAHEHFEHWMDMNEAEVVCGVFDSADYIPEDAEIIDHNKDEVEQ